MLILSYWNSDSSAVRSKNVFLVLNKGHTFLLGKLDESSLIWTYTLKQMTFSVSFSPRILQSGFTDPWWIMRYRISNECLSWSRAQVMRRGGKIQQRETCNDEFKKENSLNWQVQGMELKHSFHAYQDPQCLLCSVGLGAELINSVRLWCTFGTSTFCREVLGEELVITGRALEVFHLTKLHLSVTGDVPRGHHTWSLTQRKQYFDCSKVLIQGASNYWFYPCMWDMSAWKLCSKLLQSMWE